MVARPVLGVEESCDNRPAMSQRNRYPSTAERWPGNQAVRTGDNVARICPAPARCRCSAIDGAQNPKESASIGPDAEKCVTVPAYRRPPAEIRGRRRAVVITRNEQRLTVGSPSLYSVLQIELWLKAIHR
jgi:hypothetical protein